MPTRKWFDLIDERGHREVTCVTSTEDDNETIVHFRKRVKSECPRTLAHVTASDLIVYADRAAFDEKQTPLAEDAPIWGHGNSGGPHLVVVMPQRRLEPHGRMVARNRTRVDEWFGNDTLSSTPTKKLKPSEGEVDGKDDFHTTRYLQMVDLPPLANPTTKYSKIMEREAYVAISSELMDNVNQFAGNGWNANMIVTGTEGAGLSHFYVYAAYQLIFQHHKKVKSLPSFDLVLNSRGCFHKYCASTKEFALLTEDEVRDISEQRNVTRLIEGDSSRLVGWHGVSILFATEGLPGMHNYAKVDSFKFILPVWTLDELHVLNSLVRDDMQLSEGVLSARYYRYGGIPRFIFTTGGLEYEAGYMRAVTAFGDAAKSDYRSRYHWDFLSQHAAEAFEQPWRE